MRNLFTIWRLLWEFSRITFLARLVLEILLIKIFSGGKGEKCCPVDMRQLLCLAMSVLELSILDSFEIFDRPLVVLQCWTALPARGKFYRLDVGIFLLHDYRSLSLRRFHNFVMAQSELLERVQLTNMRPFVKLQLLWTEYSNTSNLWRE